MNILITLIIGLLVGAVAKLLIPGVGPSGIIITILLGIAGAFTAAFLGQTVGWYGYGQPAFFFSSVVGAMLLLVIYRLAIKH